MAKFKISGEKALAKALILKKDTMKKVKALIMEHGSNLQNNTQDNMAKAYIHGYSTGKTMRSTTLQISNAGLTATVEPHTEYFKWLEHGTRKMAAMPTLHPAFMKEGPLFIKDVKDAIKK